MESHDQLNHVRREFMLAAAAGAALVVTLIAGCATLAGDIEKAKESWQGARYDEVVSRWGAPDRHAVLPEGRDVYTWVTEATASGGYPASVSVFGGSGGAGVGAVVALPGAGGGQPQRCERTLTFVNARVVQQAWQGHAAFCAGFRRER